MQSSKLYSCIRRLKLPFFFEDILQRHFQLHKPSTMYWQLVVKKKSGVNWKKLC